MVIPCFNNYKKYHSIVLLALADANYRLIWVDMGAKGACSDSQTWNTSYLKSHTLDHTAGTSTLLDDDKLYPHFIIADDVG